MAVPTRRSARIWGLPEAPGDAASRATSLKWWKLWSAESALTDVMCQRRAAFRNASGMPSVPDDRQLSVRAREARVQLTLASEVLREVARLHDHDAVELEAASRLGNVDPKQLVVTRPEVQRLTATPALLAQQLDETDRDRR